MKAAAFVALIALFTLLPLNFAAAEEGAHTGLKLLEDCSHESADYLDGYCSGFIRGVTQTIFLDPSIDICIPDDVTFKQMRLVIDKYARDNPENLHLLAAVLIKQAFHKAWPCPATKK